MIDSTRPIQNPPESAAGREPYVSPTLEEYGILLDVTMGGSPGFGDSFGDPATQLS